DTMSIRVMLVCDLFVVVYGFRYLRRLRSFPTRRSSDLVLDVVLMGTYGRLGWFLRPGHSDREWARQCLKKVGLSQYERRQIGQLDRKSTRLNSSHRTTSYAVFCLKKKKSCLQHTPPANL